MRTYEAMFLLDAGNPDMEAATAPIREVLGRIQAEVLSLKPWDERRLAYEIRGRKRGLYVLTYFKADPALVNEMQREVQINEQILRVMVLSADHLPEETIHAETPATLARTRRPSGEGARSEGSEDRGSWASSGASEEADDAAPRVGAASDEDEDADEDESPGESDG